MLGTSACSIPITSSLHLLRRIERGVCTPILNLFAKFQRIYFTMERDGLCRSSLFHCRIRLICYPKVIHFPGLHAQRSGQEAINWSLPPRDNGTARDSLFSVDGKVGPATKEKLWQYAGVYLNNEGIALN